MKTLKTGRATATLMNARSSSAPRSSSSRARRRSLSRSSVSSPRRDLESSSGDARPSQNAQDFACLLPIIRTAGGTFCIAPGLDLEIMRRKGLRTFIVVGRCCRRPGPAPLASRQAAAGTATSSARTSARASRPSPSYTASGQEPGQDDACGHVEPGSSASPGTTRPSATRTASTVPVAAAGPVRGHRAEDAATRRR